MTDLGILKYNHYLLHHKPFMTRTCESRQTQLIS